MAKARLTIDLAAIAANWTALDRQSATGVETGAVVKSDAYGLGIARVAPCLSRAGARSFFVALAHEGRLLREVLGPGPRIFVFSGYMRGDAPDFADTDLIPLINAPEQLSRFMADHPGRAHGVQIDTGMHRLGVAPEDIAALPGSAPPVLIISHLACSDTPADAMNAAQRARFTALAGHWPQTPHSLSATGGTLMGGPFHFDMTRPGIGLSGGHPFRAARPVLSLHVPVIQHRRIETGEAVGYGASWTARRPSRVATVAAGYADGLIRHMGNRAQVFAGGRAVPVIGRVSMDLITVDITDLGDAPEQVEILGPGQGVDDLARAAGTIGYEILTSLGPRYDRTYVDG